MSDIMQGKRYEEERKGGGYWVSVCVQELTYAWDIEGLVQESGKAKRREEGGSSSSSRERE